MSVEPDDAVGDPVDVVLDRKNEAGECARAAGTGDVQKIRKAGRRQAEVILRAVAPLVPNGKPVPGPQVHLFPSAANGVEPGCENERIKFVFPPARHETARGDGLDRALADVDKPDIGPIERSIVADTVDPHALATDRLPWAQKLGCRGIGDDLTGSCRGRIRRRAH